MTAPTVIIHNDITGPAVELVKARHGDVDVIACETYEDLPGLVAQSDAEIVYTVRFAGTSGFPRQTLVESPCVKWVAVGGSGTDHLAPWDNSNVTVTNSAGVAAEMMAQYVLGGMLHFSLNLPAFMAAKNRRQWTAGKVEPLTGKTVLVIGLGKTGQAVAAISKAMGMRTIGVRANPQAVPNADEVHHFERLPDLWHQADYIAVCVPLLPATRKLIDSAAFAAMQKTAVVIDVSRGGVIDGTALIAALEGGQIRGAVLDVFETEPLPADSPLWAMDNLVLTPHCSSVYDGWELKSVEMFCDNLDRYRRGEPLHNVVDPERGY